MKVIIGVEYMLAGFAGERSSDYICGKVSFYRVLVHMFLVLWIIRGKVDVVALTTTTTTTSLPVCTLIESVFIDLLFQLFLVCFS